MTGSIRFVKSRAALNLKQSCYIWFYTVLRFPQNYKMCDYATPYSILKGREPQKVYIYLKVSGFVPMSSVLTAGLVSHAIKLIMDVKRRISSFTHFFFFLYSRCIVKSNLGLNFDFTRLDLYRTHFVESVRFSA